MEPPHPVPSPPRIRVEERESLPGIIELAGWGGFLSSTKWKRARRGGAYFWILWSDWAGVTTVRRENGASLYPPLHAYAWNGGGHPLSEECRVENEVPSPKHSLGMEGIACSVIGMEG